MSCPCLFVCLFDAHGWTACNRASVHSNQECVGFSMLQLQLEGEQQTYNLGGLKPDLCVSTHPGSPPLLLAFGEVKAPANRNDFDWWATGCACPSPRLP